MTKKITVLVVVLLGCLSFGIGGLVINCWRANTPPSAPIYPNSVQSNQSISALGGTRPILTTEFTSSDAPDKLVEFYTSKGRCGLGESNDKGEMCQGNATPFGEYFVYIKKDSYKSEGITKFGIEIRWHGCSDELE